MAKLIVPLGIVTYVSLMLTVAAGLLVFKYHVKWLKMVWHIRLGLLTLLLGTAHAALVIYLNF